MEHSDAFSFLIVALSYNVTIIGKIWLTLVILLRLMVIFLAAYPLYQDEQERFICNTLQPGCSNVCYDLFAPVSHFRFWLIQSVSVLLPYAVFGVWVLHNVVRQLVKASASPYSQHKEIETLSGHKITKTSFKSAARKRKTSRTNETDFSRAYVVHLILRILIEAGFGTGHYYLFGFFVPKRFSCDRFPCTSFVDCYISRPTEKSIMMLFIWGLSGFSFLLSLVDLVFAFRTNAVRNQRNKLLLQKLTAEEECGPELQQDHNPGKDLLHHGSMAISDGGRKCLLACEATEDCPFPAAMTVQQTIGSHFNSNHNKLCNESANQGLLFSETKQQENPYEQSRHEQQSCFIQESLAFNSQEVCHHRSHSSASYDKPSVHDSTLERKTSDSQSVFSISEFSKSKKSEWV
ncbi:gap junction delta-4 protein-like [Candoia aspera]|uniref:gap junction delta-4 protein-like n=1 Tax=Candoia aspera TaxID=51853 RepID=UPI002FD7E7EA